MLLHHLTVLLSNTYRANLWYQTEIGDYESHYSLVLPNTDALLSICESGALYNSIMSLYEGKHLISQHFAFVIAATNGIHTLRSSELKSMIPRFNKY